MNLLMLLIAFAWVHIIEAWEEMPREVFSPCDDESTIALACDFDNFFTCKTCWTGACDDYVCEPDCQNFSCSDMEECINTKCVGCEAEFLDYGRCDIYKDCGIDCGCVVRSDDAIEACETDESLRETCINCAVEGMPDPESPSCDGFDCDLISQCLVDNACSDCEEEYKNGINCITETYCNFLCFDSIRRLEERNMKPAKYRKVAGSTYRIGDPGRYLKGGKGVVKTLASSLQWL